MAEQPDLEGRASTGAPPSERVADADRDRTVALLRDHVVEGRLTLDEFSERMGSALQAKTRADLEAVMADLPAPSTSSSGEVVPAASARKVSRWHVAVMSGHQTRGRWRIGPKSKAVAVMGGCDIDLRLAEIEGPEIEITAIALMGGINVIVPEGFDVELRGFSFMGGRSLRMRDVPLVPGSPRIVVRGFAVMGGIEVKSRPLRSNRRDRRRPSSGDAGTRGLDLRTATPSDMHALAKDIRRQMRELRHMDPESFDPAALPGMQFVSGMPPMPRVPGMPSSLFGSPEEPATASSDAAQPEPASQVQPSDGTVTILFCDMVDYAGMTERLGDQASRRVLTEHHQIVREAVGRNGGREISVQGDGFMVAFGGVARALRCAIGIQRSFDHYVSAEGEPIAVHIGVHTGDALDEGDDVLGHTVIVASRLADTAGPGEILVSSLSEQLVQGSGEFTFSAHRETHLKGMTRAQMSATLSWSA
jgi:class 3 adenylate cyclase